jgi:predicted transcriptional regulator
MKVMSIRIKSENEALNDFEAAFRAAEAKRPFQKKTGVYFTSLEAAREFLTPKRLELIRIIRRKRPHSLYQLAHLAGRRFPGVFRDTNTLVRHGLVRRMRPAASGRRSVRPQVDYEELDLKIAV